MTKVQKFLKSLPDPDGVGQAEYRAIHELLTDAEPESLDHVAAMLGEVVEFAEQFLLQIGQPRRPPCQTVLLELWQVKNSEDRVLHKVRAEHPEFVQVVSLVDGVVDEEGVGKMSAEQLAAVEAM